MDDVKDDTSVSSGVSRASSSLEQEVRRSGRTIRQTTTYDHTTGKAAEISAVQNYMPTLQNWIMKNYVQLSRSRNSI